MKNYFVIEQNDKHVDGVVLLDAEGEILYEDLMHMSYEEMKTYNKLEDFLFASQEASDSYFNTDGENTIVNLVNEEDTLVWGILFGPDPDNEEYLRYCFIDWGIDGKIYKYKKEN